MQRILIVLGTISALVVTGCTPKAPDPLVLEIQKATLSLTEGHHQQQGQINGHEGRLRVVESALGISGSSPAAASATGAVNPYAGAATGTPGAAVAPVRPANPNEYAVVYKGVNGVQYWAPPGQVPMAVDQFDAACEMVEAMDSRLKAFKQRVGVDSDVKAQLTSLEGKFDTFAAQGKRDLEALQKSLEQQKGELARIRTTGVNAHNATGKQTEKMRLLQESIEKLEAEVKRLNSSSIIIPRKPAASPPRGPFLKFDIHPAPVIRLNPLQLPGVVPAPCGPLMCPPPGM